MKPYYDDGRCVLYNADCRELIDTLLTPSSVDMVLTDLPYGTTDYKWDTPLDLDLLWNWWRQIIRPDRAIVLTASQPFTSRLVMSNPSRFKHEWIWEKNAGSNFGTVKYQPMKEHESVLVFGYGSVLYKPIMQERAASGLSGGLTGTGSSHRPDLRYPRSIQRFNRERGLHPTQKPVDLMRYLIETYTEHDETVVDCCAGSGSTLVAAAQAGRRAIGIELSEAYCEVAATRLAHDWHELVFEIDACREGRRD